MERFINMNIDYIEKIKQIMTDNNIKICDTNNKILFKLHDNNLKADLVVVANSSLLSIDFHYYDKCFKNNDFTYSNSVEIYNDGTSDFETSESIKTIIIELQNIIKGNIFCVKDNSHYGLAIPNSSKGISGSYTVVLKKILWYRRFNLSKLSKNLKVSDKLSPKFTLYKDYNN